MKCVENHLKIINKEVMTEGDINPVDIEAVVDRIMTMDHLEIVIMVVIDIIVVNSNMMMKVEEIVEIITITTEARAQEVIEMKMEDKIHGEVIKIKEAIIKATGIIINDKNLIKKLIFQ